MLYPDRLPGVRTRRGPRGLVTGERPCYVRCVLRVIFVLAAALVVADATGLVDQCDEISCTDEEPGKQCPPSCPTCTCAMHTLQSLPTVYQVEIRLPGPACSIELPPPVDADGRGAPAPSTRPPIA